MILKDLTFLILPAQAMTYPDLIDFIIDLYSGMKSHLHFMKPLLEKTYKRLNKLKSGSIIT